MADRVVLQTERLLLRPFQRGDEGDARAYRDDPEFARYLPHIPQPFTTDNAAEFVEINMREPWDKSPTFAVVLAGRVIGTVNFEVESKRQSAMLGYAIGREWWGLGYATEAARAAMAWAIKNFCLERVWASTDTRNMRSRRVLEKLGFRANAGWNVCKADRDGKTVHEVVYELVRA